MDVPKWCASQAMRKQVTFGRLTATAQPRNRATAQPRNMRNCFSRPPVSRRHSANSFNRCHNLSVATGCRTTIRQSPSTADGGQAMTARLPSAIATTNQRLHGLHESLHSFHQSSPELHQPLRGFIQSLREANQPFKDANQPAFTPFIHFLTTKTPRHQVLKKEFPSLCLGVLVVKPN